VIRRVEPDDAAAVANLVEQGFETYRSFAPPDWRPPPQRVAGYRERVARPGNWGLVAEEHGRVVGHVAFEPSGFAGLAHLWNLFVAESHWGSGLATELHDRAIAAATEPGYEEMRLYVPGLHARARRFYEREGWRFERDGVTEIQIGLDLVELRRDLAGP
jgi:RimJ/RimL family protein N-acetyltransferase